jgi:hypothetical protein
MKIARYWTRAQGDAAGIRVTARGWSDESFDAARRQAQEVARRVAQRIAQPTGAPRYPYGDRPLPEPVISEIRGGGGVAAAITRNAYGALVMNADHMMFVDIDRLDSGAAAGSKGLFSGLFGKATPTAGESVVDSVRKVAQRQGLAGRVYRTAAGYRALITNRRFTANAPETEAVLNEFGSDRLYMRLCRLQESFRARLTPKPWRMKVRQPPVEFPFETASDQARYREWEREYDAKAVGYATCAFVSTTWAGDVLREFEDLIRFHDETTKASSGLPLA